MLLWESFAGLGGGRLFQHHAQTNPRPKELKLSSEVSQTSAQFAFSRPQMLLLSLEADAVSGTVGICWHECKPDV